MLEYPFGVLEVFGAILGQKVKIELWVSQRNGIPQTKIVDENSLWNEGSVVGFEMDADTDRGLDLFADSGQWVRV